MEGGPLPCDAKARCGHCWELGLRKYADHRIEGARWVPVDLTDVGLPEGDFKACFYIAYRGKRELAGRECFTHSLA